MSGGSEGSVVAEYEIDVYKKGAKANQLNGEKNPPAKAGVVIFGTLLMGMVILAFILKVSNVYQTHKKQTNKQRVDKRHESEFLETEWTTSAFPNGNVKVEKFKSVNIFSSSGALKCFNGVKNVS